MEAQVQCPLIQRGYPWRLRLTVDTSPGLFPSGVALVGHVKVKRSDAAPLAVLTTEGGHIARVNDTTVDIEIPGSMTANFPVAANPGPRAAVLMDFARTDTDEPEHLQFWLRVEVERPITPADAAP